MPDFQALPFVMPFPFCLNTKNAKFALIVWTCLAFAVKYPNDSTRIPNKTLQVLYGTGVSALTVKSLRRIRWIASDGTGHSVFSAIERTDATSDTWWVSFDAALLNLAGRLPQEDFMQQLGHGIPDIATGVFQMAREELSGKLPPLPLHGLRTILYRNIINQQTSTGSTVSVKPKTCPLCASHDLSTIFYGSVNQMHKYQSQNKRVRSMVSVGSDSASGQKPRWECLACGIKFWAPTVAATAP